MSSLYITTWGYPTDKDKGNPFIKEMAEAIASRGVKVVVVNLTFRSAIHLFSKPEIHFQASERVFLKTIDCISYLPSFLMSKRIRNKMLSKQVSRQMNRIVAECGRPDAFQLHYILHSWGVLFEPFLMKHGIPHVLFEHSPGGAFIKGINKDFGGFAQKDDLFDFVKRAKFRIARIPKYQLKMNALYGTEFNLLPSFVLMKHFEHEPQPLEMDTFKLLAIGSLTRRKNFILLIEAFALFSKNKSNLVLSIIGDGPEQNRLESKIEALELTNVELLGQRTKAEVFDQIGESHAVVVSSKHETFGNTVIEAMSQGKPVVSTKCDGPETIITESTGILCEQNAEALAEAIERLFLNYATYDQESIKVHCMKHYSENAVMDQLSNLYEKHLGLAF